MGQLVLTDSRFSQHTFHQPAIAHGNQCEAPRKGRTAPGEYLLAVFVRSLSVDAEKVIDIPVHR